MDLVAGDTREILLAITVDDWDGLEDRARFDAHLCLAGGLDATWLDLFADAVRDTTGRTQPGSFSDACHPLDGPADVGERSIERVDRSWIDAVAGLPHDVLDRVAGRWIQLIVREERDVDPDEKPMLRSLVGSLVEFARRAQRAPDVLFAWSL